MFRLHINYFLFMSSMLKFSLYSWTVARQAPLSRGDSPGKDTAVSCRSLLQGDLPDPGVEPGSPALAGRFVTN